MKSRVYLGTVLALICLFGTGCGVLFSGTSEDVQVTSSPPGASVYINGHEMGRTPTVLNLESGRSHYIKVAKRGYHDQSVHLGYSIGAGWVVLDLLGGFVPLVIDAATGGWNQLDRTTVNVTLSEDGDSVEGSEALLVTPPEERAEQIAAVFGL